MKFTCDSCGAQYMIGDEKLGQRGVKVRCKKCSYVIILRPPGYQPPRKSGEHAAAKKEEPSGPLTLPEDAFAPTTPIQQSALRRGQVGGSAAVASDIASEISQATSSELGLSRDFAAMGFDDVRRIEPPAFADQSGPFHVSRIGGSLVDEEPEDDEEDSSETLAQDGPPTARKASSHPAAKGLGDLGASLPRLAADSADEPVEETSVDSRSPFSRGPPPPPPAYDEETRLAEEDEMKGDTTSPSRRKLEEAEAAAEARTRESESAEEEPFNGADRSTPALGAEGDGPTRPEDGIWNPEPDRHIPDFAAGGALDARLNALERDELADMESSLNRALATGEGKQIQAAAKPARAAGEKDEITDAERKVDRPSGNMAALGALAAAAEDRPAGNSLPAFAAPRIVGESHRSEAGPGLDSPMLDHEIGSAFDAMFAPESRQGLDPGSAGVGPQGAASGASGPGAGPKQREPSTADVLNALRDPEAEKRPTKVFDIEAMQQVQAEQDIAGNGHKKPPVKEVNEWYVAINDEQVGPMTLEEVRSRWDSGDINPGSLCWKQGMSDWSPIRSTKELEVLGDMESNALTVVARIEKNEPEAEEHHEEAPTIAIDEGRAAASAASQPRPASKLEPPDEPSWRPSAASALASLAAAELNESSKEKKSDVAIGHALPATSDALEKLLQGDKKPGGSPFGSAEISSSKIRPLPKRTEVVSSVSLRDPVSVRPKSGSLIGAAIVGGCILVGLLVIGIALVARSPKETPPVQVPVTGAVATAPAPAPSPAVPPVVPAQAQPQAAVDPATGQPVPAPAPGAQVAGAPGAPPATATAGAPAQAAPAAAQPGQAPAAEPGKALVAKADTPKDDSQDEGKKTGQKPRKTKGIGVGGKGFGTGEGKKGTKEPRDAKEPKEAKGSAAVPAAAAAAPPPAPAAKADELKVSSSDEELLGAAGKKRRVVSEQSSALPNQLDESDIFGVLRKHKEAIRGCLQKQKTADPGLDGTMTVSLVIKGSGKTDRWAVSPDKFKSSVVGKCVVEAVKGWSFPQFTGRAMPIDFPVRVK